MPSTRKALKKRRIFFLSAARSDYDLVSQILFRLRDDPRVSVAVIPCAAQLSPFHGLGVREIERDGFPIVGRIESLVSSETWKARSLSFAHLVAGLTELLEKDRPDILVITGDREEHLAGAIVANFLGIHVAHLYGGDRCFAADIDEVLRPAISKLSHFHFTATESHRQRLVRMGENSAHVWATGAPSLDRLRNAPKADFSASLRRLGLAPKDPFFLVIQHPSPTVSTNNEKQEMIEVLEGVLQCGYRVFCGYPNADPGNIGIREAINALRPQHERLSVYHNLPRDEFIALYQGCSAIVGNSSSLILESTFLKKPAILVGPRQDLRERAMNVLPVGFDRKAIARACRKATADQRFLAQVRRAKSLYGDGRSAARVARLLATLKLDPSILLKTLAY
ncbi:UDP-N-acetylglucosamine 2-epimerase [soil metagenome]